MKNKYTQELTSLQVEQVETNKFLEQQEHKILGLEQYKENLERDIEENKERTLSLEVLREEATTVNEELKSEQNKCFSVLNGIQMNRDDQIRVED
jgi:hypothetical protein